MSEIQRRCNQLQECRKETAIGSRNSGKTLQGNKKRYTYADVTKICFVVKIADTAASDVLEKLGFDGAPACFIWPHCVCSHVVVTFRPSASGHKQGIAFNTMIVEQVAVASPEPSSCKSRVKKNLRLFTCKKAQKKQGASNSNAGKSNMHAAMHCS